MTTKSYTYVAAGTGIVEIYDVLVNHFTNNSFHHEVQFSTATGFIVRPKVNPEFHASIRRSSTNQFSLTVDRLQGFTAAGDVGTPPVGGSGSESPEQQTSGLSFGSDVVLISEEEDHFYIFTFSDVTKKNMNMGIACGYGYLPLTANDPDSGTTGLWALIGEPVIQTTTGANSWSIGTGYVEALNGWARSSFETGHQVNTDGAIAIPRSFPLYGYGAGDQASQYYFIGTTKYLYRVFESHDARTRLENPSQGYMYISSGGGSTNDTIHWEVGILT